MGSLLREKERCYLAVSIKLLCFDISSEYAWNAIPDTLLLLGVQRSYCLLSQMVEVANCNFVKDNAGNRGVCDRWDICLGFFNCCFVLLWVYFVCGCQQTYI